MQICNMARTMAAALRPRAYRTPESLASARPVYVCGGCGEGCYTHHVWTGLCSDCWLEGGGA